MVYATSKGRLAWEDRFRQPSLVDLRQHYNKQIGALLDHTRERLLSYEGASEEIAWEGVAWRWTFVYRCPDDPTRAWAYLIPHPEDLRLAMPLTTAMVDALPGRGLKKHIQEGLAAARRVGDVHWATWSIQSRTALDDVMDMVRRKHAFITKHCKSTG